MTEIEEDSTYGYISAINGSLIEVKGLGNQIKLYDLIKISNYNILSEVIQIYKDHLIAQCFENTHNLKLNDEIIYLGEPLSMELAPGLVSHVFDGIQRPLELTFDESKRGELERGIKYPPLSREKKWHFIPKKKINEKIQGGDVIGIVPETPVIDHKIIAPYNAIGRLSYVAKEGDYTIIDEIYRIEIKHEEKSFSMLTKSQITKARPFRKKLNPSEPLLTGIRVIDLLFPIAKGGTFAIPGGFGTGKTILQECIAKYCNADVIVYICCGEPGNEIAHVLKEFSENTDIRTGQPILDHVILVVNTSDMPVSAREASLFSGITIAEYYRDMGYDVAIVADSTSRWAESLREISSLLEEMPAEGGYPAYLSSKLSSFYERAGVIKSLGHDLSGKARVGSLTIISSISPPGGDFNEPVTSATKRVVQGIWALDPKLAYLKQYPAIDWLSSYSKYPEYILKWWNERDLEWNETNLDWFECRKQVNEILSHENEFKLVLQLTGDLELSSNQQLNLFMARLIRNCFLIQNSYDKVDGFTGYKKLLAFIKTILLLYKEGKILIARDYILDLGCFQEVLKKIQTINYSIPNEDFDEITILKEEFLKDSLKLMFRGIIKK